MGRTEDEHDGIDHLFDIHRLGLATYFLALAYLVLFVTAALRYRRVSQFVRRWNTLKSFHALIVLHLFTRTVAFALLSFFDIAGTKYPTTAAVVLYTLPEFLILSVYLMLAFLWLEIFIFSHDQFLVASNRRSFHRRWRVAFTAFSFVLYSLLASFYALEASRPGSFDGSTLSVIEYTAGIGCLLLPAAMGVLAFYWHARQAGFPFSSQLQFDRVRHINRVVVVWTAGRVVRGAVFLLNIHYEWEETLSTTYLAMEVVAVLLVAELVPLYMTLDWGTVSILTMDADSFGLGRAPRGAAGDSPLLAGGGGARTPSSVLSPASAFRRGGGGGGGGGAVAEAAAADRPFAGFSAAAPADSPGRAARRAISERWVVRPQEIQLAGDLSSDDGFSFSQRGVWRGRQVMVKGFRFAGHEDANPLLLDEMADGVVVACSAVAASAAPGGAGGAAAGQHLVKFLGVCRVRHTLYVVSEFMAAHSLWDILTRSSKPFYPETLVRMARQVALAVDGIHRAGPAHCHGALSSRNVLLDASLSAKVGDYAFNALRAFAEIVLVRRSCSAWSAPEVLRGGAHAATQASDVYSFGMVCWSMISRRRPFDGLTVDAVRSAVLKRQARPQFPPDAPEELVELVQSCWQADPDARPRMAEVVVRLDGM